MKKNFLKKLIVSAAAAATLASMGAMTASASQYSAWIQRGIGGVSSCRTDFYWTVDSRINITESSAYQSPQGLFANAYGVTRTYTHLMEHDWVSVCGPSANIGIGGCSIPFGYKFRDKEVLYNSGGCKTLWNAG
ncbi:MAG: hypothetical protein IKH27_12920 [Oscillospiraceae bacterium]|nr:hypothetical protein [Oscillospiraceae bacterium]